jgi:hypothetical protein
VGSLDLYGFTISRYNLTLLLNVLAVEERALLCGIKAILAKQVHVRLGTVPFVERVRYEIEPRSHDGN